MDGVDVYWIDWSGGIGRLMQKRLSFHSSLIFSNMRDTEMAAISELKNRRIFKIDCQVLGKCRNVAQMRNPSFFQKGL